MLAASWVLVLIRFIPSLDNLRRFQHLKEPRPLSGIRALPKVGRHPREGADDA
jgi:hypothetical protein